MARRVSRPSPQIAHLDPAAVLPGGEVRVHGSGLTQSAKPVVRVGDLEAAASICTPELIVARVPETAVSGAIEVVVATGAGARSAQVLEVATQIGDNLHPVCNPAVDAEGNIYVTLSGARGQKTPVSIFKLDTNFTAKAWSSSLTNPSGLAFDASGTLFASSRNDGTVHRFAPNGVASLVAQGLGVATGLAFDAAGNLYVGDRSGTIFKLDRQHNTYVFATLEPSVAAYHLAFGPDQHLYVTGPSTSSFDTVWRISPAGEVQPFFRGLGRPQGLAFDREGNLHAIASYQGRSGVVQISGDGSRAARVVVAGPNLVGLAFAPGQSGGVLPSAMLLATRTGVFHLPWHMGGLPLPVAA